jgi:transcriptional regulator with XRE-family HTH domain
MPRQPVAAKEIAEIAERLKLTRLALGYTQGFISTLIGSTTSSGQAWENYESGRRRISLNHALALCQKCGLTLDWIYRGNLQSLPPDLAGKIAARITQHRRSPPAQDGRRRRSGG